MPTRVGRLVDGSISEHVGDVDRHLLGEPAALRVAPVRLHVLVDPVDAFDDDLALVGQDAQDARRRAGVVAGDHLHHVVFANQHHDHLGRQADDLPEFPLAQLAGDGAEDARAARVLFRVDQDHGVAVEPDVAAVVAAGRPAWCGRRRP